MYIQKYKYLFLYMQSENMYRTCLYHVYTWIYQPKQVHTCYKQPKARYLHVLHAIKKSTITELEPSTLCIPVSCLNHYATRVHAGMQDLQDMYAFCRTSGAEPAAPPSPAMMSPASSSRRIAWKPWPPGLRVLRPQRRATVTGPGSNQVNLKQTTRPCVKSTGKY